MSIYIMDETYSKIYKKISNAMDLRLTRIELPRVSIEEIFSIYSMVLSENPNGFIYEPGTIRKADSGVGAIVKFDMCSELQNDSTLSRTIKSEADKIISLALREKNVYDVILSVYRYFVENFQYAEVNYKDEKFHRMISPFLYRESVCDGFAYAFSMIINKLHIPCGVVRGRSVLNGKTSNHAWNIIKIKNKCYHLDVTWDISMKSEGKKSIDYFLIDDNLMRKDHYWKDVTIPVCEDSSKDFYIVKNGGYLKNTKDIITFISEYLKLRKHDISFRYIGARVDSIINDISLVKMFKEAVQQTDSRYSKVHYGCNVSAGTAYFVVDYPDT